MFGKKKCPVCGGKMEEFTDDLGRRFYQCVDCKAMIPSVMLEGKNE